MPVFETDRRSKAARIARDWPALKERIREWARRWDSEQTGVAGVDLSEAEARLLDWLGRGFHGDMDYLERHGTRRSRPAELVPGTVRVISARLNYLPQTVRDSEAVLADGSLAFVSRYALGRDYHKVLRDRLQTLADRIQDAVGPFGYRVFTDSAPVMEVELAAQAGLGWRGKHTLLLEPRRRVLVLPGRDLLRPAAAARPAGDRALRHLPALHRCVPHAGDRGALPARRAPLHLLSHHRAPRQHSGGAAAAAGQSHLRLRRLPAGVPVEPASRSARPCPTSRCATAWTAPRWPSCSPGARRNSSSACRAARSGASATSAGCAISPWGWATRRPIGAVVEALRARRDHPSALVREHVDGRWRHAHERSTAPRGASTAVSHLASSCDVP